MSSRKEDTDTITVTPLEREAKPSQPPPGRADACLVVIYGSDIGRRIPLEQLSFEVGRSVNSDFTINEDSVSRHHARLSRQPDRKFIVTDLDSTNGTYVNDEPIEERLLADGDKIKVGRTIFKFMTGDNIEATYNEVIYRLMTVDGLTDIWNRRYFQETLDKEFKRWHRYRRELSLVVFDIDHFKKINDTFGHVAGDAVLRQIVQAIKPRLRNEDVFARTGGEEFAILLPENGLTPATACGEKVRGIVEATRFVFDQTAIPCTVSCGVATMKSDDKGHEALYKRADDALYRAKRGGRNQVES